MALVDIKSWNSFQAADCITSLTMTQGKHSVLYSTASAFTSCIDLVTRDLLCSVFGGVPAHVQLHCH